MENFFSLRKGGARKSRSSGANGGPRPATRSARSRSTALPRAASATARRSRPRRRGRGLMIRAGEHDRGGGDLAGERPRQGRDGAGVNQPRVRNQPTHDGLHAHACWLARRPRHRREACRQAGPAPGSAGRRCPRPPWGGGASLTVAPPACPTGSPTPAREWPQRAHRPSTALLALPRTRAAESAFSPHSAQQVSSSPGPRGCPSRRGAAPAARPASTAAG